MNAHPNLPDLIKSRENESLEFKSSFNTEVIETLVAFANTGGGKVIVGINQKNELTGVSLSTESLQNWINEIKSKTSPPLIPDVEVRELEGKTLVVFSIQECPIKPVATRGKYFKRVRNSNHLLGLSEITDFYMQSLQTSWDAYESPIAKLDDLDVSKIRKFILKVNENGRFSLESDPFKALKKLKLTKNNRPTNAAILLFSKEEPGYNVHIGRFKSPSMIIDDRMMTGTLFELAEDIMRYLFGQIKVAFEITPEKVQRNEIFEYPIPALRELVLNAIIHRDYTSPVDTQIKIFDQSISIFNPGKLYGDLTIEDLKTDAYQSHTRNKLIAEAFYLTKDIEKYGSGYIRIRKEIREYPTMSFNYNEVGNGFLVSLNYEVQKTSSTVLKGGTKDDTKGDTKGDTKDEAFERSLAIITVLKEQKNISLEQLADKHKVSRSTILRDLKKLKEQKKIQRIGGRKHGSWIIIDSN